MKISRRIWIMLVLICMGLGMSAISSGAPAMKRILVVSSYHRDYLWSQATQRGVSEAMLKYGYLDNTQQIATLATAGLY